MNHGGDYPETYDYIEYLRGKGFDITEIVPDIEGYHTIYDYSIDKKILPSWRFRWCTDKFKIRQINSYIDTPCIMYIGFDYGESKRAMENKSEDVANIFPLIDAKMNRNDCINFISSNGLKLPKKSGCWFCPFMHKLEVRELFLNYRELYDKALRMENNCMKDGFYIKDKPFPEIAMSSTPPLTSYF